jgi:hypothetical protein
MKLFPILAASIALALSAAAETPAGSCCGAADAKKEGCCAEKAACCAEKKAGDCCAEAKKTADCAACAEGTKTTAKPADKATRHPLKGVVLEVRADRNALVVKHEEIPGVMRAMTMLLKVDEPTLKAAKKNQAINAQLVRKTDGWWLEEVKPAS